MRLFTRTLGLALGGACLFLAHAWAVDGWVSDPQTGCKLWARNLTPGASVRWTGACSGGLATGRGMVDFTKNGEPWAKGEAEFRNGKREGRGLVVMADGTRFEGEYRDGVLEGRGFISWPDGARYVGDFRGGMPDGHGAWTFANGDKYEGDIVRDQREGRGIYSWADGRRYEGEWRGGKPNGRGVYHGKNLAGRSGVWTGDWHDGCLREGEATAAVFRTRAECGFD